MSSILKYLINDIPFAVSILNPLYGKSAGLLYILQFARQAILMVVPLSCYKSADLCQDTQLGSTRYIKSYVINAEQPR